MSDGLVPRNRWDLLDTGDVPPPRVSVIVCHYRQPEELRRTCAALTAQTLPPLEVIVADDGSSPVPDAADLAGPVHVVTQPDRGFRAAAARNLGARRARGEVLVFLDADVVPEPGFLAALTRRIAVCPDVLAVGRRRHADLSGLPVGGDPRTAPRLTDPAWLDDGYAATRDLLDADGRSFRFVISALLACHRSLFDDLGGFDERFVGYGGEDWDLAYRAWNNGAVLVHERDAAGWHDGPDWAGRPEASDGKDHEARRLAELVPEPSTRGSTGPVPIADVLVDLDARATVGSVLHQTHRDLRVRTAEVDGAAVQARPWSPDQLRRARARLLVREPLPPDAVAGAMAVLVEGDLGQVRLLTADGAVAAVLRSTRVDGRSRRRPALADRIAADFGSVDVPLLRPSREGSAAATLLP